MLESWHCVGRETVLDVGILKVRRDRLTSPRTGETADYHVIETSDWVNVLALTADGELVLVRQYRFGAEAFTLEIPGGCIDPGEDPVAAAQRELAEETGYVGSAARLLGAVDPNPAIQRNTCYTVVITGCVQSQSQALDPGEDIEVLVMSMDEVRTSILDGTINHSLVVAAVGVYEIERASLRP